MPNQWGLVFKQEYKFLNVPKKPYSPIFIPNIFDSNQGDLVIQISSRKVKENWKQAGTITQVLIDFPYQAMGDTVNVDLGVNQVLKFSDMGSRYKLKFDPVKWLENVIISIWRDSSMPISQISPNNGRSTVTVMSQKTITSTASVILAANASRSALMINNTGTKTVYIGYDNTVTVANSSINIPAGSVWDLTSPIYSGDVWGITSGTQTTSLNVTEFL